MLRGKFLLNNIFGFPTPPPPPGVDTNLAETNWLNIGSPLANSAGVFIFTDTNAPLFPLRFYRAVFP